MITKLVSVAAASEPDAVLPNRPCDPEAVSKRTGYAPGSHDSDVLPEHDTYMPNALEKTDIDVTGSVKKKLSSRQITLATSTVSIGRRCEGQKEARDITTRVTCNRTMSKILHVMGKFMHLWENNPKNLYNGMEDSLSTWVPFLTVVLGVRAAPEKITCSFCHPPNLSLVDRSHQTSHLARTRASFL